jgi:hypothetical protein
MVLGFDRPYAHPVGSFVSPVIPPDVEPADDDKIMVCVSVAWLPYVMGALSQLTLQSTWKTDDPDTVLLAQQRATYVIDQFNYKDDCALVQTPYWDDAEDVDDQEPADTQTWYGEVTDPEAPAGELDFVENAALWAVSGMIAYATGSIGVALAFRTFVSKFILIQKAGDVGETIRFVIDNQDAVTINTAGRAGELIEVPIIGDESLDEHQLYIIKTG